MGVGGGHGAGGFTFTPVPSLVTPPLMAASRFLCETSHHCVWLTGHKNTKLHHGVYGGGGGHTIPKPCEPSLIAVSRFL